MNPPRVHVAIQGVCAWPNLVALDDGTILAFIFNQPCHGAWEGDVDCWSSDDQGETWQFRSRVAAHEPGTNRMNIAAGKTGSGDLIVLASGWSNRGRPYAEVRPFSDSHTLPVWICRSSDKGRTWDIVGELPEIKNEMVTPFGKIITAQDGSLRATAYMGYSETPRGRNPVESWFLKGTPDGSRWEPLGPIAQGINETDILRVAETEWIAAGRGAPVEALYLYRSLDDGRTWLSEGPVTFPGQIPGHIFQHPNGCLILTYGNRCGGQYGIDARISHDRGKTWRAPFRLAATESYDCGYPSTVLRKDGLLLTAFYQQISGDYHYEMKVIIWSLEWANAFPC